MTQPIHYDPTIPERHAYVYEATEPKAVVIWLHGGGLETCDAQFDAAKTSFNCDGYTCVSLEYRMYPKAKCPEYLEDCAAGYAWVRQQYPDLPVFLLGGSAGGWLAAMLALDTQWLTAVGRHPDELAGCIPLGGQMLTHFRVSVDLGIAATHPDPEAPVFIQRRPWADEMAPLAHVREGAPPWLTFAGDNDIPCRVEENALMLAALAARGHSDHATHVMVDRDHCGVTHALHDRNDDVYQIVLAFMENHLPSH